MLPTSPLSYENISKETSFSSKPPTRARSKMDIKERDVERNKVIGDRCIMLVSSKNDDK